MRAICEECGASHDPNSGVYVDRRPDGNHRELLCDQCYADQLYFETVFGQQESRIWALKDSGLSYGEIGDEMDLERDEVAEAWNQARERRTEAAATVSMTFEQ